MGWKKVRVLAPGDHAGAVEHFKERISYWTNWECETPAKDQFRKWHIEHLRECLKESILLLKGPTRE